MPHSLLLGLSSLLALTSLTAASDGDDIPAADRAYFESKVRPILVARCYECHSGQSKTLRGGLRLDHREGLLKGGDTGPAVEPEDLPNSPFLTAIRYDDPLLQMPPKGKLPDTEIAILSDWIKRGAPDPRTEIPPIAAAKPERTIDIAAGRKHWAFQPLQTDTPPAVQNESWCRNDIDRFILAKLEQKGIAPCPEADRRALIRRAYLDLVGLPPTPEQVNAFLLDNRPDAFEYVLDDLLKSPRHGERWARHWLDLARWGESHGYEHDYDRPTAYHYRDFVIKALNDDLPYDTFVKWQLAGDEYEPFNNEALKATGFLGAGTHSTQITKNQVEKERYDELDDMLNTTGTAFLGLTLGCARCHDHKFDPIPAKDYYRLLSTFTTTVRTEIDLVPNLENHQKALEKYEREHRPYVDALSKFESDELPGRLAAWEAQRGQSPPTPPAWVVLEASKVESKNGATTRKLPDQSWVFEGKNPDTDVYTINAACDLPEITAVKIEALSDPALVAGGPGRAANGNFDLTNLQLKVGPRYGIGETRVPRLVNPKATFEQAGLPVAAVIDSSPTSGWAVDPQFGKDHSAVFEIGSNLRTDSGSTLTFILTFEGNTGHNIGRIRLSATNAPRPVGISDHGVPKPIQEILATPAAARTAPQTATLLDWYKTIDLRWLALNQDLEDHAKTAPKTEGVKALICSEGLPALRLHTQGDDFLPETHMLLRGDPNQKQEVVSQGFLQVLMSESESEAHWQSPPPVGARTSNRRRALAEWMTDHHDGAGHLLARVIVNRLWQHHFGRGLVATPSDFGTQATTPTHPELLDWLAQELIRNGWHLKPLHKQITSSATYRQRSNDDPAHAAIDPENHLLWRQTRRRLEAEPLRDSMLAVSGLLDERMYGPGSLDERTRRRSVYFTNKRSRLIPMMTLFDGPDTLVPLAERSSTTIAPQSLYLLNNPIVREWAAALAQRVAARSGPEPDTAAIDRAYQLALGRSPTTDERAAAISFLSQPDVPATEAWIDLCHVLITTNEFMYIE